MSADGFPPAAWNATAVAYPSDVSVAELFARQAAQRPAAPALLFGDDVLSYAELDARANRLARVLVRTGVEPGDPVGVYLPRGFDQVVALLAVFKAGGAYVPLDPAYPVHRADALLTESAAPVLVSNAALGREVGAPAKLVALDADAPLIAAAPDTAPGITVRGGDPACVLFTSGSTGGPKGVVLPHRAIVRMVFGQDFIPFGPDQVFLHCAPISWDVIALELWPALLHGGRCVLQPGQSPDPALLDQLTCAHRIDTLSLPASLFTVIVDEYPAVLGRVRHVLTGGDVASVRHIRLARQRFPELVLLHGYGPVESMLWATCYRVLDVPPDASAIPIGRPIANTRVRLLDEQLRPVRIGELGEVCIAGDGLAIGYLGRPELTEERFCTAPSDPAERLYRTGDLARWRPDGELVFAGRVDQQVKIRGHRVEPAEVESALLRHDAVASAVVVGRPRPAGTRLLGYVVPAPGRQLDSAALIAFLARELPHYLVPAAVLVLDELPLTPYGKIDRKALPEPESVDRPAAEPPRTPTERALVRIWADILEVREIGVRDDFFAAGGDSVAGLRVLARIAGTLGVRLSARAVFDAPTIAELAALVDTRASVAEDTIATGDGPAPVSFAQRRLWREFQADPASVEHGECLALTLSGPLDTAALHTALDHTVARHATLRTTFDERSGEVVPFVRPAETITFGWHDLTADRTELDRLVYRYRAEPFDLRHGPVVRAGLIRLAPDEHILVLCWHFIVGDAWSMGVFLRDLGEHYRDQTPGRTVVEPAAGPSHADFTRWQRDRWADGPLVDRELDYWRHALHGCPPLDLPTDRPRPPVRDWRGRSCPFAVPASVVTGLHALARAQGATLFMVLLAAFAALLAEFAGQADLLIATQTSGRARAELANLIGPLVNTLPIRCRLPASTTFRALLDDVRATVLDAYDHQDVPFDLLARELGNADPSRPALASVLLVLLNLPPGGLDLPGVTVGAAPVPHLHAHAELAVVAREVGGGLHGGVEYSTALFDETTARALADRLTALLTHVAATPDAPLSGVSDDLPSN